MNIKEQIQLLKINNMRDRRTGRHRLEAAQQALSEQHRVRMEMRLHSHTEAMLGVARDQADALHAIAECLTKSQRKAA